MWMKEIESYPKQLIYLYLALNTTITRPRSTLSLVSILDSIGNKAHITNIKAEPRIVVIMNAELRMVRIINAADRES